MPKESKFDYDKWYEENKEEVGKKRKERYDTDPQYREDRKARARYYYWTKKRANEISKEADVENINLKSNKSIRVDILNEEDNRYGTMIEVPIYGTTELSEIIERGVQTIRIWEKRGVIPEATWRDSSGNRVYTEDQMKAFISCKHFLKYPSKNIEDSIFKKEIFKAFEDMPDGVEVDPVKMAKVEGTCTRCKALVSEEVKSYATSTVRCGKCGGTLESIRESLL